MRQFRFEYSLKNIPIPSRDNYLRNFIEKVESVLKRMRWKAHFFLKGEKTHENTNHFGLSSNKTPLTILELKPVLKLLENIKFRNTHLRTILNVNQWRNTQNVIEWFGNIEQKSRHSFISFDIVDFYPSISKNLLDQALSWASSLAEISHENIFIIKHARKSLLFNNGKP